MSCRSYEAEVVFLEEKIADPPTKAENFQSRLQGSLFSQKNPEKMVCHMNCIICNGTSSATLHDDRSINHANVHCEDSRWSRSKGCFLSVGAAVISCRNEKAPNGLVADAHLADGFLHLIVVKDCPRPFYLW